MQGRKVTRYHLVSFLTECASCIDNGMTGVPTWVQFTLRRDNLNQVFAFTLRTRLSGD